ncbi:MAG: helix-turn-helix domain-containing protein [Chloroflexota bacterium]|nr:helix-turn-helix domain-containing protein [Chloroflexota bacterium]
MADLLNHVPVTASENERRELHEISKLLGMVAQPNATRLVGPHGEDLLLPASLFQLLRQAVAELAHGQVVTLVSCSKELTTQQAANLLGVSRPYLIKLLEQGEIPFVRTGTHRRILFDDLMAYKERRDAGRRKDLASLTQLSQELGLYND